MTDSLVDGARQRACVVSVDRSNGGASRRVAMAGSSKNGSQANQRPIPWICRRRPAARESGALRVKYGEREATVN